MSNQQASHGAISGIFPFGQPLRAVTQRDRTPKRVFVLGVYASAVHARWIGLDGNVVVKALAVASEPYIFWKGDGAAGIISSITVPRALGTLVPADGQFNGPSGRALDECILKPLGIKRDDAWLCDLVPHSCVNSSQQKAIDREYMPLVHRHGLPLPSIPPVPSELADDARRQAILSELRESRADVLVVLGDEPLRWFLRPFAGCPKRLAQFKPYGQLHSMQVDGLGLNVLPLAHPRQVAKLGMSSRRWFDAHEEWRRGVAAGLLG